MIILTKAMERKSKKQFQPGVGIDFSLQQGNLAMIHGKEEEKQGFILSLHPLTSHALFPSVNLHCCSFSTRFSAGSRGNGSTKNSLYPRRTQAETGNCLLSINSIDNY